ncbi:hypothetical protein ON010_g18309 [Phytophthora cinnamomi]|nr:hypothetical protein ON010_g18309 [Phytophthora cinnamomi]
MSNSAELNHVTEVIITIALLHPLARNRVVLVHDSDNSVDDNDIDDHLIPRVVSEVPESKPEHLREGDVWKITWAIGVVREIAAKLDEKDLIGKEITPGADVTATKDLEEWVFNSVFRNSHWVGSASMGTSEEKAVVDNHLRVFGIKNLRVADASVIPLIPNGNVHSSVVMVANRAAQILREDEADYRRRHASMAPHSSSLPSCFAASSSGGQLYLALTCSHVRTMPASLERRYSTFKLRGLSQKEYLRVNVPETTALSGRAIASRRRTSPTITTSRPSSSYPQVVAQGETAAGSVRMEELLRNATAFATHEGFDQRGYLHIHPPTITEPGCEGAGEMLGTELIKNHIGFIKVYFDCSSYLIVLPP